MKGKVFIDTTIYCGLGKQENCEEYVQLSSHKYAQEIRKSGWKRTKEYGWVCPECIK